MLQTARKPAYTVMSFLILVIALLTLHFLHYSHVQVIVFPQVLLCSLPLRKLWNASAYLERNKGIDNAENIIPAYDIIGDNIDLMKSPSNMSTKKQRESLHWFLNVAVHHCPMTDQFQTLWLYPIMHSFLVYLIVLH